MINEDNTPGCFKTKQFNKGNGICRQCRKYRDCEIANLLGRSGYVPESKLKNQKGGQNGNNNSKKRS